VERPDEFQGTGANQGTKVRAGRPRSPCH
jgi:hypothetical protein